MLSRNINAWKVKKKILELPDEFVKITDMVVKITNPGERTSFSGNVTTVEILTL